MATLIALIVVLLLERFWDWGFLRKFAWFSVYQGLLEKRIAILGSVGSFIALLLPFVLSCALIYYFLTDYWYGIAYFIFQVFVLFYCMGPHNLWADAFSCIHLFEQNNDEQAIKRAQQSFGIDQEVAGNRIHQALAKSILLQANERVAAVILWFILLGPIGALLYRLIEQMTQSNQDGVGKLAIQVKLYMDWLSVRVFGLVLALIGYFAKAFPCWWGYVRQFDPMHNQAVLMDVSLLSEKINNGAKGGAEVVDEQAIMRMLDRALVLSLVIGILIVIV